MKRRKYRVYGNDVQRYVHWKKAKKKPVFVSLWTHSYFWGKREMFLSITNTYVGEGRFISFCHSSNMFLVVKFVIVAKCWVFLPGISGRTRSATTSSTSSRRHLYSHSCTTQVSEREKVQCLIFSVMWKNNYITLNYVFISLERQKLQEIII